MKTTLFVLVISMSFAGHAQNWVQFGNGHPISAGNFYLDSATNTLYSSGTYWGLSGDTLYGPAYFDGTSWQRIGNFQFGGNNWVYSMIKYNNQLYVAGNFKKIYGASADYIMKWNGSDWDSLQFSPDNQISRLYEYQGWLHIAGNFWNCGPLFSKLIIRYYDNGITNLWATFPSSFYLSLYGMRDIKKFNDQLICAGQFGFTYSGMDYPNIVVWDDLGFIPVDQGLEFGSSNPEFIHRLAVYNNRLYIAGLGSFFAPGSNVGGGNIISWGGGSDWSSVGNGTNNGIYDLQVYNGELYACGFFNQAGGIPAQYIAKWDGTKWCSLGSTFDGIVTDMCVYNNELIIAGNFTHIDGIPISHMAKWIGGNFTDSCSTPLGIEESSASNVRMNIYPNPSTHIINISFSTSPIKESTLEIYNMLGEKIMKKIIPANTNQSKIDISKFSQGVYTCRLIIGESFILRKFLKE